MNSNEVKEEYDRIAPEYDVRWRKYLASTHEQAVALLEPQPGDHILDVSGGTGLLAERLRKQFDAVVTVVDFSREMLREAEARTAALGDISLILADAHSLPFEEASFDRVACLSSLHFYRDPLTALREMHRVLKPGGRLALIDWCSDPLYFKIFDALVRLLRRPHVKTYASGELEQMLAGSGFDVERSVRWRSDLWPLIGVRARKR